MMLSTIVARRSRGVDVRGISAPSAARVLLYAGVAAAVARAPVDTAAIAAASFARRTIAAHGTIPLHFGPETAASGALSGGIGWLGALILAAFAATPYVLIAATWGVALLTLALVESRAHRFSNQAAAVCAACIAALCMCDAAHAGGPLVAPLFTAALLALLDRPTLGGALLVTGLAVVWCNLSASGLFAGFFAVAAAAGMTLDRAAALRTSPAQCRTAWCAALGACAATFATPAGAAYPALAMRALRIDDAFVRSTDVAPYVSSPLAYGIGLTLVLVLALALGLRARRFAGALPAIGALVLGFANGNNVPLVGVVLAPLLAAAAAPLRAAGWSRLVVAGACIATAVANIAAGDRSARASIAASDAAPLATETVGMPGLRRLFCARPVWCTYAVAAGGHVLIDDRLERAPPDVRAAQRDIAGADAQWPGLTARYRIDALLVNGDSTLASLVRLTPQWKQSAVHGEATLFVRRASIGRTPSKP